MYPKVLTLKAPFTKIAAFVDSVDQDQAAQNVQPNLRSTLTAILEHYRQKMARKLQSSLYYFGINVSIEFIRHLMG